MTTDLIDLGPKAQRVLVGDPVRVGASRSGTRMDAVAKAEWKFSALRDDGQTPIDSMERPFAGSRASAIWLAKGPRDTHERSCTVVYTVKAGPVERDGHEQIIVYLDWLEFEAAARLDRAWAFTARGAEVREVVPEAARATAIRDVDGDGRPDVVLRSPWVDVGPCGMPDADYPGPLGLLHARPDGSFSPDDATAQAFVAHQCRERPTTLFGPWVDAQGEERPFDDPTHRVACARWWGRSAADVASEVERTYPETVDVDAPPMPCFPKSEMLRLAAIDPPQAFRLRCGE